MVTTRFAPSPTGYLHLGHALSALLNVRAAAQAGGEFLLRVEDIDAARCRPAYTQALFDDLRWLGLAWPEPVWLQSTRFAAYGEAVFQLQDMQLIYPCFCTRREIARSAAAPDGGTGPVYPGTCRLLDEGTRQARIRAGAPYAKRLHVDAALARTGPLTWSPGGDEALPVTGDFGDLVIARKELPASYHLCVVVDDAAQGVTDIIRGADLVAATPVHRLLQALLGLPVPRYQHHRLILGPDGAKLSKRAGSPSLRDLRAQGRTPADIVALAGLQAGSP